MLQSSCQSHAVTVDRHHGSHQLCWSGNRAALSVAVESSESSRVGNSVITRSNELHELQLASRTSPWVSSMQPIRSHDFIRLTRHMIFPKVTPFCTGPDFPVYKLGSCENLAGTRSELARLTSWTRLDSISELANLGVGSSELASWTRLDGNTSCSIVLRCKEKLHQW
jgi:hypothetical protein